MKKDSKNKKKQTFDASGNKGQLTKGDIFSRNCPSRDVLGVLTSRWGFLVMLALNEEKSLRFSKIREKIGGVSERMLSQTLKNLASYHLVNRYSHNVVPPVVEYSLTELGVDLSKKAMALSIWIENNIFDLADLESYPET